MLARILVGLVIAAAIGALAWRAGSLSSSGAVAAAVVGAAAVAPGWTWGALLVLYFVTSVALSRYRASTKEARIGSVVAKGGQRDAVQVLANGGVFALLAFVSSVAPRPEVIGAAALGALAGATADTWATEVGTLAGQPPRALLTMKRVAPGTSGGVSLPGTMALVLGALFVGACARLLGLTPLTAAVVVGGVAAALADSLLGETVQERRWCDQCGRGTERAVHDCGTRTTLSGGLSWMNNDAVNFSATMIGALTAAGVALASST